MCFRDPRLLLHWQTGPEAFFSNLRALLGGARPPRRRPHVRYFRDAWGQPGFPARALIASLLWHVAIVVFPYPAPKQEAGRRPLAYPRIEAAWYLPPRDFLPLRPPESPQKAKAPAKALEAPLRGADAVHPRQTITVRPLRPTHPRQTLIQPDRPPEAPKILPPLPNIVQWAPTPQPAKPLLAPRSVAGSSLRPRIQPRADTSTPEIPNAPLPVGELNIAPSPAKIARPRLKVTPMAAPRPGKATAAQEAGSAPDLGAYVAEGDPGIRRLIALSATPAEMTPVVQVPPGNLEAKLSIAPTGKQPGEPDGAPEGKGTAGAAGSGEGVVGGVNGVKAGGNSGPSGPPGVSIHGGKPEESGTGGKPDLRPVAPGALPAKPEPRLETFNPNRSASVLPIDRMRPGSPPETIFGAKRIYTLHINMPNLSSATGSWVLRFAELDYDLLGEGKGHSGELRGPTAVRKADPKYPPDLVAARIQGEVVLYAIIRKDGSVDSIQLLKGLAPQLDRNAMDALAKWKFSPAERNGEPVELEAVVYIPFRYAPPL